MGGSQKNPFLGNGERLPNTLPNSLSLPLHFLMNFVYFNPI